MRHAIELATWHTAHRAAFGKLLADQPLMQNVLADLCLESEAAVVTGLRLARAFDDPAQELFKRIATAVSKYWVCKRSPVVAGEALECLGGNGYVEESGAPRLYREMPLNSIWEGSGNVQCLDVLRALAKSPATFEAFFAEVEEAKGADARFDAYVEATRDEFAHPEGLEPRARRIVERMAKALQASLLLRHSPPEVADAYVVSRLDGDAGLAFGTLPAGLDYEAIVQRHSVAA
jgi:putative acyl-CoA dehydrogenase